MRPLSFRLLPFTFLFSFIHHSRFDTIFPSLSAGIHKLVFGAHNNNATYSDESVEVFIDDVTIVETGLALTEPVQPVGSWLSGLNHAVEPGVKRVLVFTAHVEDNDGLPNLTDVTYGGQAMTKIIEQAVGSSTRAYVVAYILEEAGIAAASNPLSTPFFIVFSYLILLYLRDDTLILVAT